MKKIILVLLAAALMFVFFGCGEKEAAAPAAGEPEVVEVRPYADQLYVEVSALNSLEYFYDHKEGMRIVGEDLGVMTEYTGPSDYDMNAVSAAVEQAVAKGAAGIVIVGWEESLNGAINSAIEQGVPVVMIFFRVFFGYGNMAQDQQGNENNCCSGRRDRHKFYPHCIFP